jgi:hypothetical protein
MTEGSVQRLLNHLADLRARAFGISNEAAQSGTQAAATARPNSRPLDAHAGLANHSGAHGHQS